MGFDAFKDEEEQTEESNESQSSYVTFKNPRHPEVDVAEDNVADKQEYYDALQDIRDELDTDGLKVMVGEFMAGAVEAEEGDPERLQQLFENLSN